MRSARPAPRQRAPQRCNRSRPPPDNAAPREPGRQAGSAGLPGRQAVIKGGSPPDLGQAVLRQLADVVEVTVGWVVGVHRNHLVILLAVVHHLQQAQGRRQAERLEA